MESEWTELGPDGTWSGDAEREAGPGRRVTHAAAPPGDEWSVVPGRKVSSAKQAAAVEDAAARLGREMAQAEAQRRRQEERAAAKARKKETAGDRNLRRAAEEAALRERLLAEQEAERIANAAANRAKKNKHKANVKARGETAESEDGAGPAEGSAPLAPAGSKGKTDKFFGKIDNAALRREFEQRKRKEQAERDTAAAAAAAAQELKESLQAESEARPGLLRRTLSWLLFLVQLFASVAVIAVAIIIAFLLLQEQRPPATK